ADAGRHSAGHRRKIVFLAGRPFVVSARQGSAPSAPCLSARKLRALPACHRAARQPAYLQRRRCRVIRVFLIAASPLARATLQNRLKAQGVKIVGSAAAINVLGGEFSDTQADVLLVDAAGESLETTIDSLADSDLAAEIPIALLTDATPAASAHTLQAGIRAVLPGEISADQLAAALQAAAAGLVVLHPTEVPAAF